MYVVQNQCAFSELSTQNWEPFYHLDLDPLTGDDLLMRDILLSAWVNFASYGDPTPPDSGLYWSPQKPDSEHLFWYISGLEPKMNTTQDIQGRWNIWNEVLGSKN